MWNIFIPSQPPPPPPRAVAEGAGAASQRGEEEHEAGDDSKGEDQEGCSWETFQKSFQMILKLH